MKKAKSFEISKQIVWEAYKRVKENRGCAGIDKETMEDFEKDLRGNLYRIWNRMSSGTYFPPPVLQVEIPKEGGTRKLGVPTVSDRIAQMVVKIYLEPQIEPCFHVDSYGYRPGKSAVQAVAKAKERCWKYNFVIDLDIEKFFDTLDRNLLMQALKKHTDCKWILLYVERWLKAPSITQEGEMIIRVRGTAQGSVISPVLSNLYLHYTLDNWMKINYPTILFERYADDIITHCVTQKQADMLLTAIKKRFAECGLKVNEGKTRIVYCKDDNRKQDFSTCSFDFLGYTFRARACINRNGIVFNGFVPGVSNKATKKFRSKIRKFQIKRLTNLSLKEIAQQINPTIRGWIEYFKHFYPSAMNSTLDYVNQVIIRWVRKKFSESKRKQEKAWNWLAKISKKMPTLFAHWQFKMLTNDSR